ncbi:EAL domain-containing protein [Marinomonas sp. 15G1-11]|uniref:EAL domain-containing protein n=1 Tax=Marinomonas phaeophyticola TaxID=3004091 RepID=A0ABT4JQH4_9GAMM|nr:EAL domain-containing protein [Marinomonas sp. 15G1-11]MCZ2720589.1 EAL domain-containing protein [Marinomonas sp. 15G1-11]
MLQKLARNLQLKQILASFGLAVFSLIAIFLYLLWEEHHNKENDFVVFQEKLIQQQNVEITNKVNEIFETISFERDENREELKQSIEHEVLSAHIIATKIYHELQPILPDHRIQHTIIETLRNIRFFDGRGYFFIDDLNGRNILMPTSPDIEGTYVKTIQDDSGKYIVNEIYKAINSDKQAGFVIYRWPVPHTNKEKYENKLSFVKKFTPYGWVIGSGDYLTHAEESNKQNLLNRIQGLTNNPITFIEIQDTEGNTLFPSLSDNRLNTDNAAQLDQTNIKMRGSDLITTHSVTEKDWGWEIIGGYDQAKLKKYSEEQWLIHTNEQSNNFKKLIFGLMAVSVFILLSALLMSIWITRTFNLYREEQERQSNILRQNQTELELDARVFNSTSEGIIITDSNNQIIKCNSAFTTITGYTENEVKGKNPSFLSSKKTPAHVYKSLWDTLKQTGHWQGEVINKHKNGYLFPEWLSINVYKDKNSDTISYIGTITDITSRKSIQEKLERLAHFDSLTDLPNRRQLNDFIKQNITDITNEGQHHFYILFMDLDNFKFINDSLGHAIGDKVLQETAKRLAELAGATNLVCRLGGDEFVAVIKDPLFIQGITSFVDNLKNTIGKPIEIAGNALIVTPSIGISQYPKDGENHDTLLKNADAALYLAKENGRNRYEFFTSSLSRMAAERVSLERDLRNALQKKQFELFYQPQIDLKTGELIGCEALIRWHHPKRGRVPPDAFIPIAEETGLIVEIGHWVLEEALQQLSLWTTDNSSFNMAINFSARQFNEDVPEVMKSLLQKYQIDGKKVTLEITESLLIKQPDQAINMLTKIRSLGINIALDDFGTGFSSLSYLKKFPLDKLKIDRSFIKEMHRNKDDIAITKSIIATAKHFDLTTIAEGVENEQQVTLLQEIGCDHIQGYFYSKPVPAFDMQQKIKQNTSGKLQLVFAS